MKLTLKQLRRTILIFIIVLISSGAGYWLGQNKLKVKSEKLKVKFEVVNKTIPQDKDLDFQLFWKVWDKLEEKYLDKSKLDKEKMFYGAIQGMTQAIGDPYTVFLPPQENKAMQEDLNGSFEGVGLQLGFNKEKRLIVIAPVKGSPAEEAGVKAGDLILHLKDENKDLDEDTLNLSLPEAVEKIRGQSGTKITLTLMNENGTEPYKAELTRNTIIVPSVEVAFLGEKEQFAHLKLTRFGDLTPKQWDEAIAKIEDQKEKNKDFKGVILDVRGNPGGYLSEAINLASEFLSKGIVVKQENYNGEVETYSVNRKGRLLDIPLIVLIDKGSASSSEILAGALQDHGRAKLVGSQSFGKGTIQETEKINGEAGLHITTAKWLTPNGTWVNEKGLKPDFEVENDPKNPKEDKQLEKAKELL